MYVHVLNVYLIVGILSLAQPPSIVCLYDVRWFVLISLSLSLSLSNLVRAHLDWPEYCLLCFLTYIIFIDDDNNTGYLR